MPKSLSILSTKTLGTEARELARSLGWTLREEDFIQTRPISGEQLDIPPETLVIFTSANGVKYTPHTGNPIACLSGQTRASLQNHPNLVYTADNATALARLIVTDARFREAVFFCARDHRPELPLILRENGIQLKEVPVYETVSQSKVIDTPYDGVLFFSPSGVNSFFRQNQLPRGAVCFAIGETTAECIKDYTNQPIIASPAPTPDALLGRVQFYYETNDVTNEE